MLLNIVYFNFIFITVKIACITPWHKIVINNLNVFLMQKHALYSYNKAAFTVNVFTNHSVLFVTFSVYSGFYPYLTLTVHVRLVKHTGRSSLIEAMIKKTTPDIICFTSWFNFKILYFFKILRKSSQSFSLPVDSPLYTRSTYDIMNFENTLLTWINS